MKYDDVAWHYGGDFPKDLPVEAGATHIGMFLAWAIIHGLEGERHTQNSTESLLAVKQRLITGARFLLKECDWKFTTNDLNAEGNKFASVYYANEHGYGPYLGDFESQIGGISETLYHVADTWENYDKLAPLIDKRYATWKSSFS